MADGGGSPLASPRDSRFVRVLFYLGEGAILGAVLYILVLFAKRMRSVSIDRVVSTGDVGFAVIWIVLLVIAFGRVLLAYYYDDSSQRPSQAPAKDEWTAIRRWPWILAVAVVVLGGLVGVSGMLTDEAWWLSSDPQLFILVTLLVGIVLRLVPYLSGIKADTTNTR